MFEKLDQLLSTCNYFIGRVHIYDLHSSGEKITELQYIDAKLLRTTVKIFRFSISIHSKLGVLKKLTSQGFLGDSDIDPLIGDMRSLVEEENNVLTALSFRSVGNIRQILAQQQKAADANGWRIAIAKALGFGEDEPKQVWENRRKEITDSLILGTGKWIESVEQFGNWVALDDVTASKDKDAKPACPVLVIEGAEKTGKTYLMANIARHLDRIRPTHSIAYYFHEGGADQQMDRDRILSRVSRCLLWQCATSSGLLIKSMGEKCQMMGYNPNVYDIWEQLFLQNDEIKKVKRPFYILIDGLGDSMLKDVVSLLEQLADSGRQTFRILVSTRSSTVHEHMKKESFACLRLREGKQHNNDPDIQMYIKHKLKTMAAFDGTNHPKAAEYREKIITKISKNTEGDFAWMTIILDKLRSKHHLADIDSILADIQKPREKQVKHEIERLNKELTSEEIKEINEVILWLLTSQVTPTLDDMNAVLSLGPHTDSLMPLRRRLNPLLDANESGRIQFRLSEIRNQIPKKRSLIEGQDSSEIADSLQKAEVETVHRFLKYVSPRKEDYEKKELERLIWGESLKPEICYDEQNAHIKVALTYLEVLTGKINERNNRLCSSAGKYLLHHLKKTELEEVDEKLKARVGPLLVKLFTDDDCIDTLFWTKAEHMSHATWEESEGIWLKENRERWLYTDDGVIELERWFSEPAVVGNIVGSGKSMVASFLNKENDSRRHEILLRVAAERLATHLFLESVYTRREQVTAVYFLNGFVTRVCIQSKWNMTSR
jgi:hypothetical protein